MNKKYLSVLVLISSVFVSGFVVGSAWAQTSVSAVIYPIAELGNCQSREACKVFCDDANNMDACLAFAESNKLMSLEEINKAKKFKEAGMTGPGGCKGKEACDKFCSVKDNMEVCISFAEQNGLISGDKLQESKKVLAAIKKGLTPPACKGQEECDAYCGSPEHMEECLNFGIEAGIMPDQKKEEAQKVLVAIKQGIKPPACKGQQECKVYCAKESNLEECIKFGEATGIIKKEEAEMARKTGGKGPGGCQNKEECDLFCENPDNSEICFSFAKDNGLIPPEELQKIENSQQQMKESFNNMPAEILNCLTSSLGVDTIEKLKSGNAMPGQKMAEQMKVCFESFTPVPPSQPDGQSGAGGQQMKPKKPEQPMQPNQQSMPVKPEKPAGAVNPTECTEDCESTGKNCISQIENGLKKSCDSSFDTCNNNCNTNVCQDFEPGNGLPGIPHDDAKCKACFSQCYNESRPCYNDVVAKESACTTTKDECVTQCQRSAAKSGKLPQPSQSIQPSQPTQPGQMTPPQKPIQPTQPTQPAQPTQPIQPMQPTQPTQPGYPYMQQPNQLQIPNYMNPPTPPTPPTQPTQPQQPMPPQQPTQPFAPINY